MCNHKIFYFRLIDQICYIFLWLEVLVILKEIYDAYKIVVRQRENISSKGSSTLSINLYRAVYQEYLPRERLSLIFPADHSGEIDSEAIPLDRMISKLPSCGLSLKIFWRRGRSPCDRCPFPGDYIVNCIFSIWTHIAWTAILCMNDSHRNRGVRLVKRPYHLLCRLYNLANIFWKNKSNQINLRYRVYSYNNRSIKEKIYRWGWESCTFLRLLIFINK